MPHPIEQKIGVLRRRVRRMAAVYGLSVVGAILLATMAVLGSLDFLFRFQDRGLRIFGWLFLLGVFGWSVYRFVFTSLRLRLCDADLARRVQRRFPRLGDRLLSAVEFLHESKADPTAGSPALREAVIAQAAGQCESLDFSDAIDPRPTRRAVAVLAAACLIVGILAVMDPTGIRIATARLANPFGAAAWPQRTHLAVRNPVDRVARGRTFHVEVIDAEGAAFPPEVRIHFRYEGPGGQAVEQTERMLFADGVMTARRENVDRPFAFRVEGGDDRSMPWNEVQVLEPPAIQSLAVRVLPPEYTGWPPASSRRHIRALIGSQIEITGRANKPLRSATLCFDDGQKLPAELDADALAFKVAFTIEKSGSYWFDLIDCDGLEGGGDRWEIQARPDAPPTVVVEQPAANLFVAPNAVVPVRVVASDDIALHGVSLAFQLAGTQSESAILLFQGPEKPPRSPVVHNADSPDFKTVRKMIDYRWELGPNGFKPGDQVNFHAAADDYRPATGKSPPRTLTILTSEQLLERIADRQTIIKAELERALQMEQACRAQLDSVRAKLADVNMPVQEIVDSLRTIQHGQREVDRVLTGRAEGVPMHVAALLADIDVNQLTCDDLRQRMTALLTAIDDIAQKQLLPLERNLTDAMKTLQIESARQSGDKTNLSLAAAAENQQNVITSIEHLLEQLTQWDDYGRFPREIGQLLREQDDVGRRTLAVGRRTLAKELRDLALQDAAELKDAGARQLALARQLDRILQEMDRTGRELSSKAPAAARPIAEAVAEAQRLAIGGKMRTAGERIEQNRIGQAVAGQKEISQNLAAVLQTLESASADAPADNQSAASQAGPSPDDTTGPEKTVGQSAGDKPGDTTEGAAQANQKTDQEAIRNLMKGLWGELPEQLRQRILQTPIEQFPPEYQSLIEEYYRRLSEDRKVEK